jgi:hypothetical protein
MTPRIFLTGILLGAAPLIAQVATPPGQAAKVVQSVTARNDATESLKSNNAQAAVATLRAGAEKGAGAASEDAQVASALWVIARNLSASQHPSAPATVAVAAGELAKARAKTNGREGAFLDLQAGELQETLLGDGAKARLFYQAALAQDPRLKEADAGLKRIARAEALALAKARENAELRTRTK